MAFVDMYKEIFGSVPKMPLDLAKTFVNRAWKDVKRQNLWSFLLFDSNWTSPLPITVGLATVTQGSNAVTVNAAAGAAINAAFISGIPTPLLQRQFRVGLGTIYNIFNWVNGTLTLTLDRPYQEASGTTAYLIFQCYYPAPFLDHWTFFSIRDTIDYIDLYLDKTRAQIDEMDVQRSQYFLPTDVVFYQRDQNPASPTYQFPVFEMWGPPLQNLTYQLYGARKGTPLVLDTDTLPPQVGEDCVIALSKKYAYEWAEANKGDNPRNSGPDFRFLIGNAVADYTRLFHSYRKDDMDIVNNWFLIRRTRSYLGNYPFYNTITGTASPGALI